MTEIFSVQILYPIYFCVQMTENRVGCTLVTQKSICRDRKKNEFLYKRRSMGYSIQLDIDQNCQIKDLLDSIERAEQSIDGYPIRFKLIEPYGPGGNNPVFEFYSRDEWNLKRLAEIILGHKITLSQFAEWLN